MDMSDAEIGELMNVFVPLFTVTGQALWKITKNDGGGIKVDNSTKHIPLL